MSVSRFSIYWECQNADKFTGVPQRQEFRNDLDAQGTFLDLPRLPAESNHNYFKRLQSVIPLRGGPDHDGLVHGITRDFGLDEKIGIKISPVLSGGKWLAPSPHVDITATAINLYSSYVDSSDNTLDRSIDIFNHGNGYLIEDVISLIQSSEFFVAETGPGMTGKEKSNGLFPGASVTVINKEWVPASTYFSLQQADIIPGSLYFTEKDIFASEVSNAIASSNSGGLTLTWAVSELVTREGTYYVDYDSGLVSVKTSATGRGTCRYIYRRFPWYVRWSPVVVYSLRDEFYRDEVFETETMLDNVARRSLVSSEGREVYTQIFDRSPCLWGK